MRPNRSALHLPAVLTSLAALLLVAAFSTGYSATRAADDPEVGATRAAAESPDEALDLLRRGNERYRIGEVEGGDVGSAQRRAQLESQAPYAIILSCSDSRAPVEVVFDQKPGNLFVVRVAGNVAETLTLASIEYAVGELEPVLLVVLGHERCGAVTAAKMTDSQTRGLPSNVKDLLDRIRPAVEQGRIDPDDGDDASRRAVEANVREQIRRLHENDVVADAVDAGNLRVVGAFYEIDSGRVHFLDDDDEDE